MYRLIAALLIAVGMLVGCEQRTTSEAMEQVGCSADSAWGEVMTLGRGGFSSPPALAIHPDFWTLVYLTSDQTGGRQVMRRWIDGQLTDPVTLTLPPIQPRDQMAFPAANNNVFVLWIDLDETSQLPALFAALVTPTTEILRGPLRMSDENERVYDHAAVMTADGSLWIAWSGATSNEPTVYLRQIDPEGRPSLPIRLASDALHPALIDNGDGSLTLLYEEGRGDGVIRIVTADGVLLDSTRITGRVSRTAGTLIHSVYAVADATNGYLFWNLTRDDGRRETWYSTGGLNAANWSAPALFEPPYQWVRPFVPIGGESSASDQVRLAVTNGYEIGVVTMRDGAFRGYERVMVCAPVIEPPALYADGERFVMAWSRPHIAAPAELQITQKE